MKKIVIILVVVIGLWIIWSIIGSKTPLDDGLYFKYDFEGSEISVTFEKIDKSKFRAITSPGGGKEIVDRKLKTPDGRVFELGLIGPIWIPPNSVKVGGNAHGDRIDETKQWKGWDIGVVRASFGAGGAVRGEWYYEKTTGFLVGGSKSTALSMDGEAANFVLVETNLPDLLKENR